MSHLTYQKQPSRLPLDSEFVRMPFGLRNAAQSFQRFIDEVLRGLPNVYAYIDDVLIASSNEEEHKQHIRQVLQRFHEHGVIINPTKCEFGKQELVFLGHLVNRDGIRPLPDKVKTLKDFPQPASQRKLREFLGLVNFYHRFIPNCAHTLSPLNSLLGKAYKSDKELKWNNSAVSSFNTIKESLAQATLLSHPKPDASLSIATDASDLAVGAVLQQFVHGSWQPLAYFSRTLSPTEKRYSTFDRELLGIYLAIKHFRHSVEGCTFHILTDHKPLTFLSSFRSDRHSPRQIRHLDFILQFTADIRHVKGSANPALSRINIHNLTTNTPPSIDLQELAQAQLFDTEIKELMNNPSQHSLTLQSTPSLLSNTNIICDITYPLVFHVLWYQNHYVTLFSKPFIPCPILESEQHSVSLYLNSSGLKSMLMFADGQDSVFNANDRKYKDIQ